MRLKDKVALVTGAGAGLGKCIAQTFSRQGASLVINDINAETGRAVVDDIAASGGTAAFIQGDTSSESDVRKVVESATKTFGRIDVLVNNAGIELVKPFHELTETDWETVMNVNLKGVFFMSKHVVVQMMEQGRGSIVNMSSMAGLAGVPFLSAYSASKGAVVQLTRTLALEYRAFNIRVNAICPGIIKTDLGDRFLDSYKAFGIPIEEMIAMKQQRLGAVEEVAAAALFLASDESQFVNGITVPVDGGYSAG
ncbi:MAG: SDR family oxidoreductase [Proteobacteria bacterium]|nr:SDR family oxidoreductase [Pseudomonadota bacterium]